MPAIPTNGATRCETCGDNRTVPHSGRKARPCPDCSYVLTRSCPANDLAWGPTCILSYAEAQSVLASARRAGAAVYGTLASSGGVEYYTRHPKLLRWQFRPIPYEEGRLIIEAREKGLTDARPWGSHRDR